MIAFDAKSDASLLSGSSSTLAWSHIATGSNITLLVFVYDIENTVVPINVTWGSDSLSLIDSVHATNSGNWSVWAITNASTGTKTITVTRSDDQGALSPIIAQATSYTGCSSTQPDSHHLDTVTSGTSVTETTTVINASCWLVGGSIWVLNGGNYASSATDRIKNNYLAGAALYSITLSDSNSIVATGNQSITWTTSPSQTPAATCGGYILSLTPSSNVDNSLFFGY